MRKDILIAILLMLPLGLWAQGQGIQFAPKGGISMWKGQGVETKQISPMGGLDLGYILRWRIGNAAQLGLRSGVGVSYSTCQLSATLTDQYDRVDYYTNTIQYTTNASAEESHQQLQMDIPVLMALQAHGFVLNLGPKLIWTLSDKYTQTIDHADIDAYYPRYKVHVYNEPSTGQLITPVSCSGTKGLPSFTLALSAEVGYEWLVSHPYSRQNEQYIGVQLYCDYGIWSKTPKQDAFLSVAAITQSRQPAAVTIGTIAASTSLHALSVGLRVYYTIQSVDYPGRGWHRYHRR